tara:strand:+ start:390 stop:983 length:594 start_codon:yes stop_codon:yes gene_type:complete
MTDKLDNQNSDAKEPQPEEEITSETNQNETLLGPISNFLKEKGFSFLPLEPDHIGVENICVEAKYLFRIAESLKGYGLDYLQCQGGYDEGPGEKLVCFYHLIGMSELIDTKDIVNFEKPREVRIKVFLDRNNDTKVPSLYRIFRGADWQERETYDMFGIQFEGHPHPKRLLMPEDWKGWPLRKDYVQPDFYEMQDAY